VRLAFLLTLLLFRPAAYSQQAQQPGPRSAGGPAADQKAIFQRALDMYKAKSYSNALRAFREAAEAGNVEAMMYVGTMQASGQGTATARRCATSASSTSAGKASHKDTT
jgi:TPR repeat protein